MAMATATSAMLLLLALPLSARAASTLAPKNIDVALTARWSRTPVELEAAEFLAEEGGRLFWSFAEAYRSPSVSSDKAELEAVEAVASGLLSPLGLKLLRSFLAAHVFSPRVQLWRQLASSEHEAHSMQDANGWVRACGRVRSLGSSPAETAAKLADEVVADGCTMPASLEEQETSDDVPLAVDHVRTRESSPRPRRRRASTEAGWRAQSADGRTLESAPRRCTPAAAPSPARRW